METKERAVGEWLKVAGVTGVFGGGAEIIHQEQTFDFKTRVQPDYTGDERLNDIIFNTVMATTIGGGFNAVSNMITLRKSGAVQDVIAPTKDMADPHGLQATDIASSGAVAPTTTDALKVASASFTVIFF